VAAAIIVASASVAVAVLAFILNQHGQSRQNLRQARLARVNSQLRDLYGPLNAMMDTNEQIWTALRAAHLPDKARRSPASATPEWRRWRDGVLQPANRLMRDLILAHADLLVEPEVPQPLRDFCAHVSALEIACVAESDGLSERPLIAHPGDSFTSYISRTFADLKKEQELLLRRPEIQRRLTSRSIRANLFLKPSQLTRSADLGKFIRCARLLPPRRSRRVP
jgi:hypothetical protein